MSVGEKRAGWHFAERSVLGLVAVVAAGLGFGTLLLLVAGHPFVSSAAKHWEWAGGLVKASEVIRWPVSLGLIVVAVGLLFRWSPRRHQPALSWLLFGAVVATVLWWLASLLLAGYVRLSGGFGATYGPLTAIIALLLWANLTGIALLFGLAFAAQLESCRTGRAGPVTEDPGA